MFFQSSGIVTTISSVFLDATIGNNFFLTISDYYNCRCKRWLSTILCPGLGQVIIPQSHDTRPSHSESADMSREAREYQLTRLVIYLQSRFDILDMDNAWDLEWYLNHAVNPKQKVKINVCNINFNLYEIEFVFFFFTNMEHTRFKPRKISMQRM